MRVNLDSTRALLSAIRHTRPSMRVIYASSLAVYGRPFPASGILSETTRPTPESSYGAEKLICETLINDYSRRGFISGLVVRFPTVTVRPGAPTAAASSFLSGMVREPLNGVECVIPVEDRGFGSWICSPRTLVGNLVLAIRLDLERLPRHCVEVNMPGIFVTIQDMLDALEEVGGKEALGLIREETDPKTEAILRSWAERYDNNLAYDLGFKADGTFLEAVRDYKKSLK